MNNQITPPYDIEIEEQVLGSVIFDNNRMEKVVSLLKEEYFYLPAHRMIYKTALEIHRSGGVLDLIILSSTLSDKGLIGSVGGEEKLFNLISLVLPPWGLLSYIDKLNRKYLRRRLLELSQKMTSMAVDESEDLTVQLQECEKDIFALSKDLEKDKEGFVMASEFLVETYQYLDEVISGKTPKGLSTGLIDLDDILNGGLKPQQLCILAARPGMGKSTLAINIAHHVSTKSKKRVAFVSYEMSRVQIGLSLVASHSLTPIQTLIDELSFDESLAHKYLDAIEQLSNSRLSAWETHNTNITSLKTKVRETVLEAQHNEGFGLLIIDYLQLMEANNNNNRALEISNITRELKKLAMELHIPILALSQLNRDVETRNNKRPQLSDLRESGAIEQDADLVMMLYRHEYYEPECQEEKGIAELNIVKQRQGKTGTIKLNFAGEIASFRNLARL